MKKRVLTVMIVLILVCGIAIPANSAKAAADITPPKLLSFEFSKSSYVSGEDIIVTIAVFDGESGMDTISSAGVLLKNSESSTKIYWMGFDKDLTSPEDAGNGKFTLQYKLAAGCLSTGQYYISEINLSDASFNTTCYSTNGYGENKIDKKIADITNTSGQTDFTGPDIQSIDIDRSSVSVGESVGFTIRATDTSGLRSAAVILRDPDGRQVGYPVALDVIPGESAVLKGSFIVTDMTQPGIYTISFFVVYDYYNNESGYSIYYGGYYSEMPNEWRKSFTVINTGYNASDPTVTNISFSKSDVKPGDTIKITADIKDNGSHIMNYAYLYIYSSNHTINYEADLVKDASGKYTRDWIVPANFQRCSLTFGIVIWKEGGIDISYNGECNGYRFPEINVGSVFSGLDDRSIIVGSDPFDPLAGVAASDEAEGDLTSRITVLGSVDTNKTGVYLLRYRIQSNQKNYNGSYIYYYESRWIGVTEIMPDTSDLNAPLALTDNDLQIGAESSDVSVRRDGQDVSFSNTYTMPGVYTVSESGANTAQNASNANVNSTDLSMQPQVQSIGQGEVVTAVIDRSGPDVTATWQKSGSEITVSITANDVSGVAELKYLPGECSLEQVKSSGITFTGTFTAADYGQYTVYSRDNLGYESSNLINITAPVIVNPIPVYNPIAPPSGIPFPYLAGVNYSAGSISRPFAKNIYRYKLLLGENEGSVTLTPARDFGGAVMTINGKAVSSYTLNLANGKSAKISVKVKYGKTSKTYTFTVTRAKSTNNALSSLGASAGTWSQPFDPNVTNYTLTLPEGVKSTAIQAAAAAGKAARVSPASPKVTLNNGQSKTVRITVKAQSGAKRTYTITVVRAASTNADLKSLKTSTALSPAFNPNVTSYAVTLPANKAVFTVSAKAAGYKAVVYIDGAKKPSKKIALANGQTAVVVVRVVSQAGNEKQYIITVTRQ